MWPRCMRNFDRTCHKKKHMNQPKTLPEKRMQRYRPRSTTILHTNREWTCPARSYCAFAMDTCAEVQSCSRTSISGWSVGTFMEVAVLLEPTRAVVRSGVPMKKASAPSARQARATTLVNIIFDSGREEKRKRG